MDTAPEPSSILEAYLFYEGGEASKKALIKDLSWSTEELTHATDALQKVLKGRGIILTETEDSLALKTAPACASVVALLEKDLRERDLGQAGLEVLGVIVYRGTSSKADIDFIRGVNSASTIRHLELRGLIERIKREGERSNAYRATTDTLGMLGSTRIEDLPEWNDITTRIASFERQETTLHS